MNKEINKKYFSKINCPKKCEFKNGTKGICFIPLPSKTFFILISRDPTINWYKNYYSKYNQIREVLFHSAIPQWLIERISNFVPLNKKEKEQLSYIINEQTYWTHLHKCFTDKAGLESHKFKNINASLCADRWLAEELNILTSNKTKCIIALGNDVQKWICEWKEDNEKNIKIIYLPHPSGVNVGKTSSWNKKTENRNKILHRIKMLFKLSQNA